MCSGASDISVFEYCKSRGIDFYIKKDFHGKLYQIKPAGILIGSFNLTGSGFGLVESPNDEAGVCIPCSIESTTYIENLFSAAKKVDEKLFKNIKDFLDQNSTRVNFDFDWPKNIKDLLEVPNISDRYLVNLFAIQIFMPQKNHGLERKIWLDRFCHKHRQHYMYYTPYYQNYNKSGIHQ
ncbi:MAG: hypothetical protein EBU33_09595 [Sphingobacteriia bacterium]|nr:hypothetical protein [Sphingobacteriia bacterium]